MLGTKCFIGMHHCCNEPSNLPFRLDASYQRNGTTIKGRVARNLNMGPMPVGSKKNRSSDPTARVRKPERHPKTRKQIIQIVLIGSIIAIPKLGTRGRRGVKYADKIADNAMKMAAAAMSSEWVRLKRAREGGCVMDAVSGSGSGFCSGNCFTRF
jgi:hypothetical protein